MLAAFLSFLLLLCFPTTVDGIQLTMKGNVTVGHKSDYNYRHLTIGEFDEYKVTGGWFHSKSTHERKEPLGKDLIESVVYTPAETHFCPPTAFLAYFISENDYHKGNYSTMDVTNAAGFVALEALDLVEIDQDDKIVKTVFMSALNWTKTETVKNKGGLYFMTFKGVDPTSQLAVSITFVSSNRLGKLNLHDRTITPLNLEIIVRVENFSYVDRDNGRLRLTLLVASKDDKSHHTKSEQQLESGADFKHVYALITDKGWVGHEDAEFTVSKWKKNRNYVDLKNPMLQKQLMDKYEDTGTVSALDITFPAGASDILMDPIILGTGRIPAKPGAGMRKDVLVVVIIAIILGLILVVSLIAMVVYRYRQRQNYNRI